MKKLLIALILLFGLSTPCLAEWGKEDAALLILELIDWGQSRTIATEKYPEGWVSANDGTKYIYSEKNPLLGDHPSLEKVDIYFSLCILTNYLIAKYANEKFHKFWAYSAIIIECHAIQKNHSVGVKIKF